MGGSAVPADTFRDPYFLDILGLKDGIAVAEYWTALPPKAELQARIREIYDAAAEKVARRAIEE
ncbi:MAG: hypothetical protein QM705_00230 [Ancrocorticia sp.]